MEKTKKSNSSSGSAEKFSVMLASLLFADAAFSQQSLETAYRTTGEAVTSVLAPQQAVMQASSAVIYNGRKEIAYGTVVSPDGYILTKASQIEPAGELGVRVDKELFKDAKVVLTDGNWDVALLKVDAENLVPVAYAPDSNPAQGTWVVVNGVTSRTKRRVLAGVISANAREIPAAGGPALGVTLGNTKGTLEITEVSDGSGAQEAGLKKGDVITKISGTPVTVIEDLVEVLGDMKAGDIVKVTLNREGRESEADVRLTAKGELFTNESRNDQMSGDFSKRRSGFPRIIQHDILAAASTMGGPVINLQGLAVGMNIARANRCETFAIPADELRKLAEGMVAQARE